MSVFRQNVTDQMSDHLREFQECSQTRLSELLQEASPAPRSFIKVNGWISRLSHGTRFLVEIILRASEKPAHCGITRATVKCKLEMHVARIAIVSIPLTLLFFAYVRPIFIVFNGSSRCSLDKSI